jgi:UDP-glucose 4-epimerase
MKVLITGGAGYIGSHTALALLEQDYEVVVVDNLSNSSEESLKRVRELTGKDAHFYKVDACDEAGLTKVFESEHVDSVIHFAGLKAVGESVIKPLLYYRNNILSTITLCQVMEKFDVRNLVFSSSATVYGHQATPRYNETMPLQPVNPYGHTKAVNEQLLSDLSKTHAGWRITALRYFNPVGAHPSGKIGEDPDGIPNNLFPYIAQVAASKRPELLVFGDDYDTPDGTGVRDYIHVVDVANGHIAALQHAPKPNHFETYNLGSGQGHSVLEVIHAFEAATQKTIPYKVVDRRAGDLAIYYADPSKAETALGWKATQSLEDACRDTWRWQSSNANGYASL